MKLPKKSIESIGDTLAAMAISIALVYIVGVMAGAIYNLVSDVLW